MIYNLFIKRILDLLLSFLAIVFFLPLLLFIGLLIKLDSKGPVFFRQERLGENEQIFMIYKFRTMTHKNRETHHQIFQGNQDVTKVGAVLRRFKLDEVPQMFNVFRGEMSIIGPRPCLPQVKTKFGRYAEERFKVKPGLSSLAAIKGSVYLTWEEKGYFDAFYVQNISFLMDLKITLHTLKVVFVGEKRLFKNN